MKNWIFNIIFTVFLVSIITLIIPSGKLKKNVQNTFALIIMIVIIQPFSIIKKNQVNFDYIFEMQDFYVQTEYLDYINSKNIESLKKNCVKILEDNGVFNAEIEIICSSEEDNALLIENILINLRNSVIKSDKDHIDIIEGVKTDIASYLLFHESQVVIYE